MVIYKKKKLITSLSFLFLSIQLILFVQPSSAENHVGEILETIQRDLKTLEKAVYSDANSSDSTNSTTIKFDQNSEDVLTRHLLKLSGIESQFQDLTNKFEEINFKLDKLSNRLSKIQSDNQLRFQQIEENSVIVSETPHNKPNL